MDSVEKLLDYTKAEPKFRNVLLATERADSEQLHKKYDELLESASAVRVRPEEMYFVTSHRDLDAWLKVMARTHVAPKGILLYDDDQVVVENFASDYEGNHKELGAEIGRAVGVDKDFWRDEMGFDPKEMPRSGHKGQVLLESVVKRGKSIHKVDGELKVVER